MSCTAPSPSEHIIAVHAPACAGADEPWSAAACGRDGDVQGDAEGILLRSGVVQATYPGP